MTSPALWPILAAPLLLAAADPRTASSQIQEEDARPIEQISTGGRALVSPPAPPPGARQTSAPQLSSEGESRPAPAQLTSERGAPRNPSQLYSGGKTAQPSEALSRPSEGRTAATSPVRGNDRCDPAAARDAATQRACAAVIERRSAEFARPQRAELSPEERILVEQRARSGDARDATRRLADTGTDANSIEAQGIASLVLRDPVRPRDEEESAAAAGEVSPETVAIINAIVEGVTGQGSGPPP